MSTSARTVSRAYSFVLCALALACADAPDPRLSLLLVTLDTQRADHLGSYGSQDGLTPELDRFAERAVQFRNAVAPMATTFPSHTTMFTGVYPRRHRVRWNGDSLDSASLTLAEQLGAAGFETGAFVSYRAMLSQGGLAQGFDALSDEVDGRPRGVRAGAETVRLASEWLSDRSSAPFFLWVHLYEPHVPYPVTPYAAERMRGYTGVLADGASIAEMRELGGKADSRPADIEALRALYAGRVRDADALFGRLLAALAANGLGERTRVVVVGDHGELLGEHGTIGHGAKLWEEALRVPFLIASPGGARQVVDERVGLVDLTPTLLELAGLPVPAELDGRSLVPALRGEALATATYFAEVRTASKTGASTEGPLPQHVAVWRGPRKLVRTQRGTQLFDLASDPAEKSPLAAAAGRDLEKLAQLHDVNSSEPVPAELDAETLEELRSLGYVE